MSTILSKYIFMAEIIVFWYYNNVGRDFFVDQKMQSNATNAVLQYYDYPNANNQNYVCISIVRGSNYSNSQL